MIIIIAILLFIIAFAVAPEFMLMLIKIAIWLAIAGGAMLGIGLLIGQM